MPTSGSTDFSVTKDDIIKEAYEQLGVLNEGEDPTAEQIDRASRTLNMMMKAWQADQMNIFAVDRYALFVEKGTQKYDLFNGTTSNFTKLDSIRQLATTAASTSGTSTITVNDVTNVVSGDFIGVASGTEMHWSTVAGTPMGNVVTLMEALPFDIEVDAVIWTYRTKAKRPMQVMEAYTHITRGDSDIPVEKLSRRRYDELSIKSSTGLINQFYYDPQRTQGHLYVWPTGSDETNYIKLIVQRTLDDLDGSDDEPDFPQEWFLPLALNLAVLIAPKVGTPPDIYQAVSMQARYWYETCKDWDEELYTSLYFRPDDRWG